MQGRSILMYKKMLVPLDGSELAEATLPYAEGLAGRLGADAVLLHVAGRIDAETLPLHMTYVEHMADVMRNGTDLVRAQSGMQGNVKVEAAVVVGYPADEILRYADESKVDFILMSTHGRSGINRWVMGSVADKILHSSSLPVFLVRSGVSSQVSCDKWPEMTLMVPLDGSGLAEKVLPHVEALAKGGQKVNVVLLRVCEPLATPFITSTRASFNWGSIAKEYLAESRRSAEDYLKGVGERFGNMSIPAKIEVLDGNPAEEIMKYAGQCDSGIIVMATHGRSGVSRATHGSVAQKVLQGASNPILLIRPES
jgi:nucleotide-binding universal stress UspA family protein